MDRKCSFEQLYEAFQSLPEDQRNRFLNAKEDDIEYQLFLSRILCELEMLNGGVIDQSKASNGTKNNRPKKKIRPSADKRTGNLGSILGKLIIECSYIAVNFISACGLTWLTLSVSKYIAYREDRLIEAKASKDVEDFINGIIDLKDKCKGKWEELAGDVKAIVKDDIF